MQITIGEMTWNKVSRKPESPSPRKAGSAEVDRSSPGLGGTSAESTITGAHIYNRVWSASKSLQGSRLRLRRRLLIRVFCGAIPTPAGGMEMHDDLSDEAQCNSLHSENQ